MPADSRSRLTVFNGSKRQRDVAGVGVPTLDAATQEWGLALIGFAVIR